MNAQDSEGFGVDRIISKTQSNALALLIQSLTRIGGMGNDSVIDVVVALWSHHGELVLKILGQIRDHPPDFEQRVGMSVLLSAVMEFDPAQDVSFTALVRARAREWQGNLERDPTLVRQQLEAWANRIDPIVDGAMPHAHLPVAGAGRSTPSAHIDRDEQHRANAIHVWRDGRGSGGSFASFRSALDSEESGSWDDMNGHVALGLTWGQVRALFVPLDVWTVSELKRLYMRVPLRLVPGE